MMGELIQYRGMIKHMFVRDLKLKYERSVFGFAWTLLNPAAMLIVYTVFFSLVMRIGLPRYPIFLLSGLLAWNFVSRGMTSVSAVIWHNGYLISRVPFPHESLVISGMLSLLTDFLLELLVLMGIMAVLQVPMSWAIFFVPVAVLILFVFGMGIALFLSVWVALYRDMDYVLGVAITAWLYASPVFYPMTLIPERYLSLYRLNPMVHLLSLFREPIYSATLPHPATIWIAVTLSLVTFLVGWVVFRRYSPSFAELI